MQRFINRLGNDIEYQVKDSHIDERGASANTGKQEEALKPGATPTCPSIDDSKHSINKDPCSWLVT